MATIKGGCKDTEVRRRTTGTTADTKPFTHALQVAEFTQKEDATMAQFKALLDRGPIQIQKR